MYPNKIARNWERMVPPARPSLSERKIFGQCIAEKPHSEALVMGSTIELRELCYESGIAVTSVDYSVDNYSALSADLPENKDKAYICQDWRDFETSEKFDLILGDLSFNMLTGESESRQKTTTKDEYRFTLNRMFQWLKPDGIIVQRIWVRQKHESVLPFRDVNEIMRAYRSLHRSENPFTALFLPLAIHCYDFESEQFVTSEMVKRIQGLFEQGTIMENEFYSFYFRSKDYTFPNSILDETELDDLISEVLPGIRVEKEHGTDSFAELAPIYILRR